MNRLNRQGIDQCLFAACMSAGLIGLMVATSLQAQQPASPAPTPVNSSTVSSREGRQVKLYDQLRVGLKAKTKEDLQFLQHVVQLVDQGTLPRKMVDATFLWARNRYKKHPGDHRLRPIVYFKPGLTAQAKKIGIEL